MAKNFLAEDSVLVAIDSNDDWTLVLTPSRQTKPSQTPAGGPGAAAQTAAWVPTALLTASHTVKQRIVVSVSKQSLTIENADGTAASTFDVGVGAEDTPTPTGVFGYIQARYLDPAQGQNEHRIQLTSLHATATDEPYRGSDGGLIGVHFGADSGGAISHGCIRGDAKTISAVDALPLGTPIYFVE